MRERHARDRHAQIAGIGEVRKTLSTWRMFLREKDLALPAVSRSPLPEPPLKRAQRAGAVLARMAALEFFQQRHAVEVGLACSSGSNSAPQPRKRIWSSPPLMRRAL